MELDVEGLSGLGNLLEEPQLVGGLGALPLRAGRVSGVQALRFNRELRQFRLLAQFWRQRYENAVAPTADNERLLAATAKVYSREFGGRLL